MKTVKNLNSVNLVIKTGQCLQQYLNAIQHATIAVVPFNSYSELKAYKLLQMLTPKLNGTLLILALYTVVAKSFYF